MKSLIVVLEEDYINIYYIIIYYPLSTWYWSGTRYQCTRLGTSTVVALPGTVSTVQVNFSTRGIASLY